MAKHGRRRSRRFAAVRVNETLLVGSLASLDLISSTMITMGNEAYLISADLTWSWNGITSGAEGPLYVGLAHGDYSATEIEEWIEAVTSADPNDKIAQERSRRLCRAAGVIAATAALAGVMDDGRVVRTKMKFKVQDAGTLQAWAYNLGAGGITTGSALQIFGQVYLNWQ